MTLGVAPVPVTGWRLQARHENQWRPHSPRRYVHTVDVDAKTLVEDGYDEGAERYLARYGTVDNDPRIRFTRDLMSRLADGAQVLELGCGAGVPATALLAERLSVLGVDISTSQLALAQERVPNARFRKADMTRLDLPPASFEAITAFYSLNHVPRGEHVSLFAQMARWLRPGGLLLVSLGTGRADDEVEDWLGVPMFFASHDLDTNRRHLTEAGFTLLIDERVTTLESLDDSAWHWILAEVSRPD